ncbi:hypothetical protein MZM54_03485 [[Brevibacterium] frigoritolerans]|nr:hypothetical protein [Peribacillus frigoritolerans]
MPSKIKITGTPLAVRKERLNDKTIFCVDFVEGGNSAPPKGLPKPTKTLVTVLLNEKQYKKNMFKRRLPDLFLLVEGEVTLDVPSAFTKGEFAVVCFKMEEIQKSNKE